MRQRQNLNESEFSHCCKSSRPHIRLPNLIIWSHTGTGSAQGIWLWRTVRFNYRTCTGLGEIETLGGHKQYYVCTRTLGTGAVTLQETESDLPMSVWGSPGRQGQQWPAAGKGALAETVLGGQVWHKSSWRSLLANYIYNSFKETKI